MEEYGRVLYEAIFTNKIIIVSDGSEKDGNGVSAWILTTEELFSSDHYIQGQLRNVLEFMGVSGA